MPRIKLLDEALINKIAAGEVIERPASLVKELMENAVDADATSITVEADEGGKSRIKVTDNGCGMEKEDSLLCLERHATSKIATTDDLFNIKTMGFRGEALASIAAVSELVLKTKTKENKVGFKILATGGRILETQEVAVPEGTSVEVTNLFFNVPARKKHLKTIQTELRQITELMTKFALCYPEKSFKFVHQGQELLFSPATTNSLDAVLLLYGKKVAYGMLPVDSSHNEIVVRGFLSKPTLTRGDKTIQHIFINKRAVKNQIITKAVYDAYHTLLHLDNHPLFVLHVAIVPSLLDVNVHPQKAVIRVEKEQELYTAVFNAVRSALDTAKLIPVIAEEKPATVQAPLITKQYSSFSVAEEKQAFFKKEQQEEDKENADVNPQEIFEKIVERFTNAETLLQEQEKEKRNTAEETPTTTTTSAVSGTERISSLKLIGCIQDTFYLAENELGLVIIDQHASHERVLYEKFMQQFYEKNIPVQELLAPEEMEFSPTEMLVLQENKEVLERLGFLFEEFGRNTMLLRTIPSVLGRFIDKEVVHEILVQLGEKTSLDMVKEEKIIRNACRAAVKAHDVVHLPEMKTILQQLQQCRQPFTCPHGRPTMIQFTIPELEKKFKRVV